MANRDANGYVPVVDDIPAPRNDSVPDGHDIHIHAASLAEKKRLWWRNAVINMLFMASWFCFAMVLSVYNKWMFSPDYYGFPYPLFVTMNHMFVQFALAALLRHIWPRQFRPEHDPIPKDYVEKAFPAGIATGLDIGLGNVSLKLITLSFYTMVKSSSLIFVLLFAFLLRLEVFSWRLIGVIALIVVGVLLMVATETQFVLSGFLLCLSASAMSGLRWGLTQVLLKDKKMGMNNPAAALFWLSPIMAVSLGLISLFSEGWIKVFSSRFFSGGWQTAQTCFFLVVPGILAFCMVLSEYNIINRAGVVPMSIAGIAKEVCTITLAAWFFGDELTPLNITGVAITACGISLYTYHKYRKSIESKVALDSHGNPINETEENIDIIEGELALENGSYINLETEQLLAASETDLPTDPHEPQYDENQSSDTHATHNQDLLFDVGEEAEDAEDDRPYPGENDVGPKVHSLPEHNPPPYTIDGPDSLQRVWADDTGVGPPAAR